MRHRTFVMALATVAMCLNGCAYMADRGRDAADIFTGTVGVGVGVAARVGPLGTGLFHGLDAAGLRGGLAFAGRSSFPTPPSNSVSFLPFMGLGPLGSWQETFSNDYLYERHKGFSASSLVPFVFWLDSTDGYTALHHYTQVEVAAGLVGTVRLGVNFGEIVDFVLGWTTLDIMDDDLSKRIKDGRYEPREWVAYNEMMAEIERAEALLAEAEAAEDPAEAQRLADKASAVLDDVLLPETGLGKRYLAEYDRAMFAQFRAYLAGSQFARARSMPRRDEWAYLMDKPDYEPRVQARVDALIASEDSLAHWKGLEFWLNQNRRDSHEKHGPIFWGAMAEQNPVIRFRALEWQLRFEDRSRGLPPKLDLSALSLADPDAFIRSCATLLDRQIKAYFALRKAADDIGRYATKNLAFTPMQQFDVLKSAAAKLEADDPAGARVELNRIPPQHKLTGVNYETLERLKFEAMCRTRFFEVYGGLPDASWDDEVVRLVDSLNDPEDPLARWKYYEFTMTMSGGGKASEIMAGIMANEPVAMQFAALQWLDRETDRSLRPFRGVLADAASHENEHIRAYADSLLQGR